MNGIAPELVRRTRQTVDTDDLALTYVENEIGRFDFARNWEVIKSRGNTLHRIRAWLDEQNVDSSPEEIIATIDRLASNRPGKWV